MAHNQGFCSFQRLVFTPYMHWVAVQRAFDSVKTSTTIKAFKRHGVEEIYVKELEDIYKEIAATIKVHKVSDEIPGKATLFFPNCSLRF